MGMLIKDTKLQNQRHGNAKKKIQNCEIKDMGSLQHSLKTRTIKSEKMANNLCNWNAFKEDKIHIIWIKKTNSQMKP